jgi:predicted permease
MPDRSRWLTFCRSLAPAELRERVFDPAIHDLRQARALRSGGRPPGVGSRLRDALAVLTIALECRRVRWSAPDGPVANPATSRASIFWTTWSQALRQAARRLRREPLFAFVAVATLALGIGANVAVFGFINAYLLAPLPVADPHDLVRVYGRTSEFSYDVMSYPTYKDIRDGVPGLDLAAHGFASVLVGSGDAVEARPMELVTGNYFRMLRLTPFAGRFVEGSDDGAEGTGAVVVLGESLWRSKYAADRGIIGQTILLNGAPFQVVGIAPARFHGTEGASSIDLWATLSMQQVLRPRGLSLKARGWGWLGTIGRLSPGTTAAALDGMLARVAADIAQRFPATSAKLKLVATPASVLERTDRDSVTPVAGLTIAFTALLLVVTCANLAGLMQARAVRRRREMAVRHSLGAGRGRLLSEWLAECVVLAVAGGAVGLLVARLAIFGIAAFKPPVQLTGDLDLAAPFDWRVLLFAAGASLAAAAMFGLWPALRASAAPPTSLLKEDAVTTTGGRRGARMRRVAVLVQVAASAVLLVSAALLSTSLRHLQAFDPGFRTDNVSVASVDLGRLRIPAADQDAFRQRALAAVRSLPGVATVDIAYALPLMPGRDRIGFTIPGHTDANGLTAFSIDENAVGSEYFAAMGMTFVAGGTWNPADPAPGIVINETMAKRFWPDRNPVGQTMAIIDKPPVPVTIAGVVRDSAYYQLGERPMSYVFLPAEVVKPKRFAFVVRTSGTGDSLSAIGGAIASADPRVKPYEMTTFEEARQVPLYPQKMLASAAAIFGTLALVLTGLGLYGVVSTSVGQRTREIGVRMALGARASDVQSGVIGEALVLVAFGAVAGLVGGYALSNGLTKWLFGVTPFDLAIYTAVVAVLAMLAIVAAWAPARRAAKVDPVVALRT